MSLRGNGALPRPHRYWKHDVQFRTVNPKMDILVLQPR